MSLLEMFTLGLFAVTLGLFVFFFIYGIVIFFKYRDKDIGSFFVLLGVVWFILAVHLSSTYFNGS